MTRPETEGDPKNREHFTDLEPFADRVRDLLRERGMSQAVLAELIGINPSHMSRLLNGDRAFMLYHVEQIAKAFSITAADLVAGTDHEDDVKAMGTLIPRAEYEAVLQTLAQVRADAQAIAAGNTRLTEENAELVAQIAQARAVAAKVAEDLSAAEAAKADTLRDLSKARAEKTEADRKTDVARRESEAARTAGGEERLARMAADGLAREQRAQINTLRQGLAAAQADSLQHEATIRGLRGEVAYLRHALTEANRLANANYAAYQRASAQLAQAGGQALALSVGATLFGLAVGASSRDG
jgi:transcriptional regulator with XRE-family HTH domain